MLITFTFGNLFLNAVFVSFLLDGRERKEREPSSKKKKKFFLEGGWGN